MAGYWAEFFGLALIHALAMLAPGPDFAVTVRQSLRFGRRIGIYTALGIAAGIGVHVAYTLLGLSALLHTQPNLMLLARVLGALYLVYLGVRFLCSTPVGARETAPEKVTALPPMAGRAFLTGFMTNATNPKVTLFFLAIFTTVVQPTTPLGIQLLYGLWMCGMNVLWFSTVSLLFSSASIRRGCERHGHWLERCMGVVLIGFAARLALTSL